MKDEMFDKDLVKSDEIDIDEADTQTEIDEEAILREIDEFNELKEGPETAIMPDESEAVCEEDDDGEITYGVDSDGEVVLPDEDEEIFGAEEMLSEFELRSMPEGRVLQTMKICEQGLYATMGIEEEGRVEKDIYSKDHFESLMAEWCGGKV